MKKREDHGEYVSLVGESLGGGEGGYCHPENIPIESSFSGKEIKGEKAQGS